MKKGVFSFLLIFLFHPVFAQVTFVEFIGVTGQTVNLDNPQELVVSPDGKHVYVVTQSGTDGIVVFSRDASTGKLTFSSDVGMGSGSVLLNTPRGIAISKDGGFVYVTAGSDDALNVFSRNSSTGALTFVEAFQDDGQTGGTINTLDGAWSVVISPDNKHLIVTANSGSQSGFSVFTRNTSDGTLTFLQDFRDDGIGGTIVNLQGPRGLDFSPDGKFVYVTSTTNDALNVFSRDTDPSSADFGKLTFESVITSSSDLDFLEDLAISPDNNYVYLTPKNADKAVWASRNTSTGALTIIGSLDDTDASISSLDGIEDVVLSTDASQVFFAVSSDDLLSVFSRNSSTGALTPVQEVIDDDSSLGTSSTDFGLNNNEGVAVSPDGKHLYALGQFQDVMVTFSLNTPSDVPEIDLQQGSSIANGGSFDFGTVAPGTDSDVVFTIANTGGANLYAYDAQTSGEFSIQSAIASSSIAGSGSTTFTVRFSPSSNGAKTAQLLIVNTDADEGAYTITLNGTGGTVAPTSATVAATVFLEGAYNGTDLNTTLNSSIPLTQPYTNNGHSGGSAVSIPANAVDWVLVELREAGSAAAALNSTKVGSTAGFLMNDGTIKATDGTSDLTVSLSGNSGADFFVVIYHRNHLPIMSASAISESSGTYTIDFTSSSANTHQTTTALASLSGGKFGMPSGDADGDGDVDGTDLTTWRSQNGSGFTYNTTNADFNLDGVINAVDRNLFWKSNNTATKTSQVPTT